MRYEFKYLCKYDLDMMIKPNLNFFLKVHRRLLCKYESKYKHKYDLNMIFIMKPLSQTLFFPQGFIIGDCAYININMNVDMI